MAETNNTPNWANLIPDPDTDPVSREDLETAALVLTGWRIDALHLEELMIIADAYARTVADGRADPPKAPGEAREALLSAGWVPTGPLPQTWAQAAQNAGEAAQRAREDGTRENVQALVQAIEHLCDLLRELLGALEGERAARTEGAPLPEAEAPAPDPAGAQVPMPPVATAPTERGPVAEPAPVEGLDTQVDGVWMRTCPRCRHSRGLETEYHRDSKGPGGRRRTCRVCCSEVKRKRRSPAG